MNGERSSGAHAELYVRSLSPRGLQERQDAVLDRLERLADGGPLRDYEVRVCGTEAPASPAETRTGFGEFLLDRAAVFAEWARRNDYSLESVFETRTVDSSITGQHRETLVVPVMALAEYEGRDLRFVSPCSVDGTTVTVRDRLDDLREGVPAEARRLRDARATSPASPPLVQ